MEFVQIQVQDLSGTWRTYINTENNSQIILMRMRELQKQFPNCRIRAVDKQGRIIDIL